MSELPIPYEITVVQDMVTDPAVVPPLANQWQRKPNGNSNWSDIQNATGETYTTNDGVRNEDIRVVQTSSTGATGYSNSLRVTNILEDNLALGQRPGRPIETEGGGQGKDGPFTAIGGGVGAKNTIIFYQGDGDGYYVKNGVATDWVSPIGGKWDNSWKSPWGGAAHTSDGKYIVRMPGNYGLGYIARSKNANFTGDDRPTQSISAGLSSYPSYGSPGNYGDASTYFSGCTGSNVQIDRFYGTPSDHDKVMWIDADQSTPQGSSQYGFITINLNGSSADLSAYRKWGMGALAGNGKIYCMPRRLLTKEMLIIDTNNDTAEIGPYIDEVMGASKKSLYSSGTMGKDGCLYFLPNSAKSCWKLDPSDDSLTEFGTGARLDANGNVGADPDAGFGQTVLYPDGHIYCKQNVGGKHWLIQLDTDNFTWRRWEVSKAAQRGWTRSFMDLDANIYWTPSPTALATVDVWNRGYGRGPWPMPGVPGGLLDPRLPFFNHAFGY